MCRRPPRGGRGLKRCRTNADLPKEALNLRKFSKGVLLGVFICCDFVSVSIYISYALVRIPPSRQIFSYHLETKHN